MLSLVAVLAAYSGFAAAKWGTESSVSLARASAFRAKANRADLEAIVTRTLDSVSFNAWFTAFTAGNARAEQLAVRSSSPRLPTSVPCLAAHRPRAQPNARPARRTCRSTWSTQDIAGRRLRPAGRCRLRPRRPPRAATSDKYVRDTVFLATVLFLVGISSHFPVRQGRYALVGVGILLLVFSVIQLLGLPAPP